MSYFEDIHINVRWRPQDSLSWRICKLRLSADTLIPIFSILRDNSCEIEVFEPAKGAWTDFLSSPLRIVLLKVWEDLERRKSVTMFGTGFALT